MARFLAGRALGTPGCRYDGSREGSCFLEMRLLLKEQRVLGFKAREAGAQLWAGSPARRKRLRARMAWKPRGVFSWRPEGPLGHQGATVKNLQKAFVFHSTLEA